MAMLAEQAPEESGLLRRRDARRICLIDVLAHDVLRHLEQPVGQCLVRDRAGHLDPTVLEHGHDELRRGFRPLLFRGLGLVFRGLALRIENLCSIHFALLVFFWSLPTEGARKKTRLESRASLLWKRGG